MADVASALRSWSATESSNLPAGTTSIGTGLDDNLRQIQATVRKYLASTASNMASSGTVDLATADGYYVQITGTTTITALGTESAGISYLLRFAGALTLTYNATSLILPGGASITTAAGDMALMISEGSGNWRCVVYQTATGVVGVGSLASGMATFLATPSSANLRATVTDETGTGALVFADSPTLVTPALGTPASGVMTNVTGTAASLTAGTATAANGLKSATTTVSVSGATAPSSGQVLTATASTTATWQTPSAGVSSLNSETGAIVNTDLDDIGSTRMGARNGATSVVNTTYAAAAIYTTVFSIAGQFSLGAAFSAGTWRCLTADGYDAGGPYHSPGLFVRIS